MNLILFRHGEATDNVNELISDREIYWSVLTENGEKTVAENSKRLPKVIDKMYVSPFPRTIQTANIIYQSHPNTEVAIDNRIREIFYGEYSGGPNNAELDEVRRRQAGGDYGARFGKLGESRFDIENRLILFLKDIFEKNEGGSTILIVSHGSITSYIKRILGVVGSHIKPGNFEIFNDVDSVKFYEYARKFERLL